MAGLANLGELRMSPTGRYQMGEGLRAAREWVVRWSSLAFLAGRVGGMVPPLLCWKISLLLSSVENIITDTSWHVILPHLLLSSTGLVLMVHF